MLFEFDPALAEGISSLLSRNLMKSIYMPLVYGKSMYAAAQDIQKSSIGSYLSAKDCNKLAKSFYLYWNNPYPSRINLMKLVSKRGWMVCGILE